METVLRTLVYMRQGSFRVLPVRFTFKFHPQSNSASLDIQVFGDTAVYCLRMNTFPKEFAKDTQVSSGVFMVKYRHCAPHSICLSYGLIQNILL